MCRKLWSFSRDNTSDHSVTTQRDPVTWCSITSPIYPGGLYNPCVESACFGISIHSIGAFSRKKVLFKDVLHRYRSLVGHMQPFLRCHIYCSVVWFYVILKYKNSTSLPRRHVWDPGRPALWSPDFLLKIPCIMAFWYPMPIYAVHPYPGDMSGTLAGPHSGKSTLQSPSWPGSQKCLLDITCITTPLHIIYMSTVYDLFFLSQGYWWVPAWTQNH